MVLNRRSLERSFSPMSKVKKKSVHVRKSVQYSPGSARKLKENAKRQSNVKVVVRVRPTNERESGENYRSIIQIVDDKMLVFDPKIDEPSFFYHGVKQNCRDLLKKQNKDTTYIFDKVFGFTSTNKEVFEGSTKEMIKTLLSGYNCSVFVYGATGAGKTYTMLGSADSPGITYLTMVELYSEMENLKDEKTFDLCVSYLEVYNENVRDLLQPSGPLHVREDSRAGVSVAGLRMETIDSADKLLAMLAQGNKNRTQHPTDANSESSRSHAVFQVHIRMTHRLSSQISLVKLSMVDLAGSERGSATGCTGARFTEGANINKSLLALGNCITNLADGLKHIPYRDSKLTRLLKDSLGGNCYTVMIANISPSSKSYEDTQNTLKYATRAMKIKSTVKSNIVNCEMHVSQYAKLVEELNRKVAAQNDEISKLKEQLKSNVVNERSSTEKTESDEIHHWRKKLREMYKIKKKLNSEILLAEMKRKILKWRAYIKEQAAARVEVLCYDSEQLKQAVNRIEMSQKQYRAREESYASVLQTVQNQEKKHRGEIDSTMKLIEEAGFSEFLKEEILVNDLMIERENAEIKSRHLKKLITLQQNEMEGHCIMFKTICCMMKDYYLMLKGFGKETNAMKESYQQAVRMMVGIKGITWEDSQNDHLMDLKEIMRLSAALQEGIACVNAPVVSERSLLRDVNRKDSSGLISEDSEQQSGRFNLSLNCNEVSSERPVEEGCTTTSPFNDEIFSLKNGSPECSLYYTDEMGITVRTKFSKDTRRILCSDDTEETGTHSYEAEEVVLKYEAEKICSALLETESECHSSKVLSEKDLNNTFSCKTTTTNVTNSALCKTQDEEHQTQEREKNLLTPVFKYDPEEMHAKSHILQVASEPDLNATFSRKTETRIDCADSVTGDAVFASPHDSEGQQPDSRILQCLSESDLNNTFSYEMRTTKITNSALCKTRDEAHQAQESKMNLLTPVLKCDSEEAHAESHILQVASEPDLNATFSHKIETKIDCGDSVTGDAAFTSPHDSEGQQPEGHILQRVPESDLNNTFSCETQSQVASSNPATCAGPLSSKKEEKEFCFLRPVGVKCVRKVQPTSHISTLDSTFRLLRDVDASRKPSVQKLSPDSSFVIKRTTGKCKDVINKTFLQHKKVLSPATPGKRNILSNRNTTDTLQKDIVGHSDVKHLNNTGKMKNSLKAPSVQNSTLNKENIYTPNITKRKIKRNDSMKLPMKKNQESMFPSRRVSPPVTFSGIANHQQVGKPAASRHRNIVSAPPNCIYGSKTLPETITQAKRTCLLRSS
ncbi:kinesin-like protein KIN-5B [Schistocerca piceifrons]|uniref:kinesin-like protein KIN-5B n=1 Tax=Schistocerca piceifrons TaxID=274613 RepID=UPI001F5EFEA9|nr:kinesin-like protein KIN-5B [Schistocerca piceifrons]XP_047115329.1 kinesin-like protein KIN-5B [Schistocerca piceifrons]XP_047115330.1 kinesin-like protein KIN-5B [Schistocerca piceifrons]